MPDDDMNKLSYIQSDGQDYIDLKKAFDSVNHGMILHIKDDDLKQTLCITQRIWTLEKYI